MGSIVVAGLICLDLAPEFLSSNILEPGKLTEIGPTHISIGGCVGNAGLVLVDLEAPVRLSASVGDDDFAFIVRERLAERGVLDKLSTIHSASTSYSVVVEPRGHDRAIWHHSGSNDVFDGATVDLTDASVLHVGYPSLLPALIADDGKPLRALLERARVAGLTTSMDLAVIDPSAGRAYMRWRDIFDDILPLVDIFSPSVDDLISALGTVELSGPELVEYLADYALASGVAVAAVSSGALGTFLATTSDVDRLNAAGTHLSANASAWTGQRFWQPPLLAGPIVTTNGAGDALSAGLLDAIVRGRLPVEALRFAAATAAVVLSGQRPTRERVEAAATTAI